MDAHLILDHILREEVKIQELEKELEEKSKNQAVQLEKIQKLEAEIAEKDATINKMTREKEELVEALRKAEEGSKETTQVEVNSQKDITIMADIIADQLERIRTLESEKKDDKALIRGLSDLAEKNTGEEKEDVIFKQHCKLYYKGDMNINSKNPIEGEMQILKNLKDHSYWVIMQRETTEEVLVSHKLTSRAHVGTQISLWSDTLTAYTRNETSQFTVGFSSDALAEEFVELLKEGINSATQ